MAVSANFISAPQSWVSITNDDLVFNRPVNLDHIIDINAIGNYIISFRVKNNGSGEDVVHWSFKYTDERNRALESILRSCTTEIIVQC